MRRHELDQRAHEFTVAICVRSARGSRRGATNQSALKVSSLARSASAPFSRRQSRVAPLRVRDCSPPPLPTSVNAAQRLNARQHALARTRRRLDKQEGREPNKAPPPLVSACATAAAVLNDNNNYTQRQRQQQPTTTTRSIGPSSALARQETPWPRLAREANRVYRPSARPFARWFVVQGCFQEFLRKPKCCLGALEAGLD